MALSFALVAVAAVVVAGLLYWLSDLAYDVHWLFGAPIRIVAFITALGAAFTVLGALLQLVIVLVMTAFLVARTVLGNVRRDV